MKRVLLVLLAVACVVSFATPVMANGPPARGAPAVQSFNDPPMDICVKSSDQSLVDMRIAMPKSTFVEDGVSMRTAMPKLMPSAQNVGFALSVKMSRHERVAIESGCRPTVLALTEINRLAASSRAQLAEDTPAGTATVAMFFGRVVTNV